EDFLRSTAAIPPPYRPRSRCRRRAFTGRWRRFIVGEERTEEMIKIKIAALAAGALTFVSGTAITVLTAPAANASRTGTFKGTYQHMDGCVYLQSAAGYHYYLEGYTRGANGGLYKKGGGFVAYPGWRIAARGIQYNKSGGATTCTTWGVYRRIRATSVY